MLEKYVRELLYHFEIGPKYRGHHYLISGVLILEHHPDYLLSVTKCLYPEIARKHHTTVHCVERDIRTVIEIMWRKECRDLFEEQMIPVETEYEYLKRPTNTQFFEMLSAYLQTAATSSRYPEVSMKGCEGCLIVPVLHSKISSLEQENKFMHDLIWQMLREQNEKNSEGWGEKYE